MKQDIRICFFGDSYTAGIGDKTSLGWVGRISKELMHSENEITCYNLGIRKNTCQDIEKRWKNEALIRLPQHTKNYIVFAFGTNDTNLDNGKQRVSFEEISISTNKILSESKSYGKALLIGSPPMIDNNHNQRIFQLDKIMEEISNKNNVEFISLFKAIENSSEWINEIKNSDGYHPNYKGYEILYNIIKQTTFWNVN
jgi:acyl-CoA thioesterase-1